MRPATSGLFGNLRGVPGRLTPQQSFALIEELDTATKLIEFGLADLREQALEGFHHLPLQLLAQGLERFLKLTYVLAVLHDSGGLPSIREVKRYSHDLERLADKLVSRVAPKHAVQVDIEFIRTDGDLRSLLRLLSDFGQESRYHHLDALLEPASVQVENDPARRWSEFEDAFISQRPDWIERMRTYEGQQEVFREAATAVAALVDQLSRAIARMWTQGALPEEAARCSAQLMTFLFLRDNQLGVPRT
jgi:hypothetical protein